MDYGLKVPTASVLSCGFVVDSFDKTTNQLVVDSIGGCGGTSGPQAKMIERKIVSAKEKGNTIVVNEKAIYYDVNFGNNNDIHYTIYGDNNKTEHLDYIDSTMEKVENITISFDSYSDKASTITHTYKLNPKTNKYYFVSSTIN